MLENLRETKHMINSLQEREKARSQKYQLHEQGSWTTWWTPRIRRVQRRWLSLSLVKGRNVYESAVQMAIDAKQQEIDKLRYAADRKAVHRRVRAFVLARGLRDEVL